MRGSCVWVFFYFSLCTVAATFGEPASGTNYLKCIANREREIAQFDRIFAKAEVILQDSDLNLECFSCLSENNTGAVEDAPKPNESFLGRRFSEFMDDSLESKQWKFKWQFSALSDKEKNWKSVSKQSKSGRQSTSFMKRAKGESRIFIGSLFELEVASVNRNDSGFYRCVNNQNKKNPIENLYFIDVSNRIRMESKKSDFGSTLAKTNFPKQRLETVWKVTHMSECNRCNERGEIREQFTCYLRITDGTSFEDFTKISTSPQIYLFGEVPCASSLVPVELRPEVYNQTHVYDVVYSCEQTCSNSSLETRTIHGLDENGEVVAVDTIPPDEFALYERLPPLMRPVKRRTLGIQKGEPVVADCGSSKQTVFWKKNDNLITSEEIHLSGKSDRIFIRASGELFIKSIEDDDEGLYVCFTKEGILLRTFNVVIITGKFSEETIAYLKIVMRAAAVLLLFIVIISVVRQTRLHAEKFEHENAKKVFIQTTSETKRRHERRKALRLTKTRKKPKVKVSKKASKARI